MAFVWNPNPNPPPANLPVPVADGELSYEQKEVANSVNTDPIYGIGYLSQNVSSDDFDIIYALPTLNVKDIHVTHLESTNITVNFNATINTANIGVATINTANIVNATIANGHMGLNPTANLQIATREYVDALAANSVPLGGNLQLLILAAGDLLVGVSDNTAERLPIGSSNGQVLAASSTSGNTGVHWAGPFGSSGGSSGIHRGLSIGTHLNGFLVNTQIQLQQVDEIVMDDGSRYSTGWSGLIADNTSNVATSGIGYLDTGVVQPNSCYEVWAVRNSTSGSQGLLLHRTKDIKVDVHYAPFGGGTAFHVMNFNAGAGSSVSLNVAQRFVAHTDGPFVGIDLSIGRQGTLTTGNIWVTLESNIANNNASGIILATSRKYPASSVGSLAADVPRIRFIFDVSANVVQGNVYWAVVRTNCPIGDSQLSPNSLKVFGDTATPSLLYDDGPAKFFNANTGGWALSNSAFAIDAQGGSVGASNFYHRTFIEANDSAVLMPTGYDQKCLLSYASTTKRGFFREYHQSGYKMTMAFHYLWGYLSGGGLQGAGGQDMSTSNNAAVVAFPNALHLGAFVPPVPCLLWVYNYSGLSGATELFIGGTTPFNVPVQLFSEQHGGLCLTNAASSWGICGPFFVEKNFHYHHTSGATFGGLYIAGIEF